MRLWLSALIFDLQGSGWGAGAPPLDHVRKLPALIRLRRTFGINENEKDLLLGCDPTPTCLLPPPPGPRWKRRLHLSSLVRHLEQIS